MWRAASGKLRRPLCDPQSDFPYAGEARVGARLRTAGQHSFAHGTRDAYAFVMLIFLAGVAGGGAFYFVWRSLLPRTRSRVFWQAVPVHASGMLHCADPDEVMQHYGALMKHAASFAGRNTLAVVLGLVPVAALFLLADAMYSGERRAAMVEVRPAITASSFPTSEPAVTSREGALLIDRRGLAGELRLFGETLDSDDLANKRAFCSGWISCLGYDLMLFETHRLQAPPPELAGNSVVIRPRIFAANPFWPVLDDLELAFLAGVMAGGIAASWRSARASKVAA
jgi:hypothetical protein